MTVQSRAWEAHDLIHLTADAMLEELDALPRFTARWQVLQAVDRAGRRAVRRAVSRYLGVTPDPFPAEFEKPAKTPKNANRGDR